MSGDGARCVHGVGVVPPAELPRVCGAQALRDVLWATPASAIEMEAEWEEARMHETHAMLDARGIDDPGAVLARAVLALAAWQEASSSSEAKAEGARGRVLEPAATAWHAESRLAA